ncbi:MAG: hypothetical protein ACXAEF_06530 [Candidatus Thorarchaeota archaeon]
MSKGRGHVLGSEPPVDPMTEMKRTSLTVTSSDEIRWDKREIQDSWTLPLVLVIVSFLAVLYLPLLVIVLTVIATLVFYYTPRYLASRETVNPQGLWNERPVRTISLVEDDKTLRSAGERKFSVVGFDLKSQGPRLSGSLASLIRALPSSDGFTMTIAMESFKSKRVLDGRNLTDTIELYLRTRSSEELDTYMDYRSGLWGVRVSIIGMTKNDGDKRFLEASVKGAIPSTGWKSIKPSSLHTHIVTLQGGRARPLYLAVGKELSNWLVQLRSELASEVGTNVPGQFVVDIRSRDADLPLGVVVHPDTLQEGPTTGLSHNDISDGVLLCGGSWPDRKNVIALLTKRLIDSGKRVMILSSHQEALDFVGLHDAGIGMVLGKDLVINPIDPENIPRTEYVPQMMRALESLSGKSLTAAADLELALGRSIALGNQTVADVRIDVDPDVMTPDGSAQFTQPNKASLLGLDALKRLHQGSGARAFYGTQTMKMSDIAQIPLSVIVSSLKSAPLDLFAFDVMLMKLAGLKEDENLVIIIDDPDNLRIANTEYSKRALWTDSLIRNLSKAASVVISFDQPHMLSTGVKNLLSSCISFRLRDEKDIAAVSSRLALSVIGTGLHSKARWSARESSFLRTMKDGVALLVHNEVETAQPIRLQDVPDLLPISSDDLRQRTSGVSKDIGMDTGSISEGLLHHGAGSIDDLSLRILRLLERYEPLTEEAVRRFIQASGDAGDVEGVLIRLKEASLIMEGHESHSNVAYKNYRLTMKGTMALRQSDKEVAAAT